MKDLHNPSFGRKHVDLGVVTVLRETAKALLVEFADGSQHWVPKSQIRFSESNIEGGEGPLVVSAWWAEVALGVR